MIKDPKTLLVEYEGKYEGKYEDTTFEIDTVGEIVLQPIVEALVDARSSLKVGYLGIHPVTRITDEEGKMHFAFKVDVEYYNDSGTATIYDDEMGTDEHLKNPQKFAKEFFERANRWQRMNNE